MGLTQSSVPYNSFEDDPSTGPRRTRRNTVPHSGSQRHVVGQGRRNNNVGRRVPNSGRRRQGPEAGAAGHSSRQPSRRSRKPLYVHRVHSSQRRRKQRNNPSSLRNGLVPEEAPTSSSEQVINRSAAARFPKLRAPADTRGVDYEDRTLALAFLRCLRDNLRFDISSNNEAAGKFDDLVLRWRYNNSADTYLLLAQLKHKSSMHGSSEVTRAMLLPHSGRANYGYDGRQQNFGGNNNRFSLAVFQDSYHHIKDKLEAPNFTLILSTNATLASDTRGMLVRRSLANVPGAEFLDTGGTLYGLNPNDEEVRRAVHNDLRFIEHFTIFCHQKDSEEIKDAICREIDILLAPGEAEGYIYENLCREIREWKLNEDLWLSDGWKKWIDIVNDYTEKFVCQCGDKSVRPPIVFNSVDNVRKFVNSCNPAQITPVRRSTMALTASKIHQALGNETHILLTAKRYQQLRQQVLCVWDRFCKWLVILDDGPDDDANVFEELTRQLSPSRRLVFVTSKKDSSFLDTFGSLEVSNECWSKFLEIRIRLNGENYLCCLGDLVGDTASLKILLDSRPEDVLTLSQITGTLDIGQQLDPVPEYHISRRVVVRRCVTDAFFLSLGEKDVCIINRASYPFLPARVWSGVILDLRRLEIVLGSPNRMWPLLTIAGDADRSAIAELRGRYPDVCLYALNCSADGWEMLYFSGHSDRIQPYIKKQVKQAPENLDLFRRTVILEGAPGVGKSTMLSAVARNFKATDPAHWIVKVNFSEFYSIFDNCDNSADALEHILMHVTSADDQLGRLERTLLRYCLQHSPRVICLVDGFDELTSAYTGLSLQALNQLAPNDGGMLVTVRPTAKKQVEETLGSMACLLTVFSDTEWQVFLTLYRPTSTNSIDSITAKFPKNLFRFPLFCKMCADLTACGLVADATELYNAFFRSKCERLWMKKQGANLAADGGMHEFEEQWKRYEEQLMYLAESFLVQRKDRLGQRPYYPINRDFFVEAGIMCKSADGRLSFVHRTFAEYFLAKWCIANIKKQECAATYREALLDKNLEFFLWTFHHLASKGRRLLELIVDGNESGVMFMLNSQMDIVDVDDAGRNALHLATVYSEPWTVVQRLCTRVSPSMLEAEDDLLHWTPLRYAVELGHWPTAAALVKAGAQLKNLGDFRAGKYDLSELRNWLPESTFKEFMDHVNTGNRTGNGLHENQSKTKMTSYTLGKALSDSSQQPLINTGSVIQSNEGQSTTKTGTFSEVTVASRNTSQPYIHHQRGTDSGLETNESPGARKTIMTSPKMTYTLSVPQPQVHNRILGENSLQRDERPNLFEDGLLEGDLFDIPQPEVQNRESTVNGSLPKLRQNTASSLVIDTSNTPQQHAHRGNSVDSDHQSNEGPIAAAPQTSSDVEALGNSLQHHRQNTDSILQSNASQATAAASPYGEVWMDPNYDSQSTISSEKSRRWCCQFWISSAFQAVFCYSTPVTDNGPDHSDSNVTHIH